jgi:hypothetical protein
MTMSDVGKKWREGHFGGAVKWLIPTQPATSIFVGRIVLYLEPCCREIVSVRAMGDGLR